MDKSSNNTNSDSLDALLTSIIAEISSNEELNKALIDQYHSIEALEPIIKKFLKKQQATSLGTPNDNNRKELETHVINSLLIGKNIHIGDIINVFQNKSAGKVLRFQSYIFQLTQNFQGRQEEKVFIKNFITVNKEGYLFIKGQAGIGKSTLLAQTYAELLYEQKSLDKFEDCHFIPYFFQQGAQSSLANNFFQTLKTELDQIHPTAELQGSNEMDRASDFHKKLKIVSEQSNRTGQKIIFLIDGLDENEAMLPYLINDYFENVIVIYTSRPTELVESFEIGMVSRYSLIETKLLKGLDMEEIDELIIGLLSPEEYTTFIGLYSTKAIFEDTNGNPLHIFIFIKEWSLGGISKQDGLRIPRLENLYKKMVWRLSRSGRTIEAVRLLCFSHQELSLINIERVLHFKEEEMAHVASAIGEVVTDYSGRLRIFHKTFLEYVVKAPQTNQNKYEILLAEYCAKWFDYTAVPTPENIEALEYALRNYSEHLYYLATIDGAASIENKYKNQLFQLCDNREYKVKQINFFGEIQSSIQLIEKSVKLAEFYEENQRLINIGLNATELHILNSNRFNINVDFITSTQGDVQKVLDRIEFNQPKEQFILYLNLLHQLLFNKEHPDFEEREALELVIEHLGKTLGISKLNWKEIAPDFYINQIVDRLGLLKIDSTFLKDRQHGQNTVEDNYIFRLEKVGLTGKLDSVNAGDKSLIRSWKFKFFIINFWPFYIIRYVFFIILFFINVVIELGRSLTQYFGEEAESAIETVGGLLIIIFTVRIGMFAYGNFDVGLLSMIGIVVVAFIGTSVLVVSIATVSQNFIRKLFERSGESQKSNVLIYNLVGNLRRITIGLNSTINTFFKSNENVFPLSYYNYFKEKWGSKRRAGLNDNLFSFINRLAVNPLDRINDLAVKFAGVGRFKKSLKIADKIYHTDRESYRNVFSKMIARTPNVSQVNSQILDHINLQVKPMSAIDIANLPSFQFATQTKKTIEKYLRRITRVYAVGLVLSLIFFIGTFWYLAAEFSPGDATLDNGFSVKSFMLSQTYIQAAALATKYFLIFLSIFLVFQIGVRYFKRLNTLYVLRLRSKFSGLIQKFGSRNTLFDRLPRFSKLKIGFLLFLTFLVFLIFTIYLSKWLGLELQGYAFFFILLCAIPYTFLLSRIVSKLLYTNEFSVVRPFYIRYLFTDEYLTSFCRKLIAQGKVLNAQRILNRLFKKNDFHSKNELEQEILMGLFAKYVISLEQDNFTFSKFSNNYEQYTNKFCKILENARLRNQIIAINEIGSSFLAGLIAVWRLMKIKITYKIKRRSKPFATPEFLIGIKRITGSTKRMTRLFKEFKQEVSTHQDTIFPILFFELASFGLHKEAAIVLNKTPEKRHYPLLKSTQRLLATNNYTALLKYVNNEIGNDETKAYANQFLFQKAILEKEHSLSLVNFMISSFYRNREILAQSIFVYYYHLYFSKKSNQDPALIKRIESVIRIK